jgi:hypothetical protein
MNSSSYPKFIKLVVIVPWADPENVYLRSYEFNIFPPVIPRPVKLKPNALNGTVPIKDVPF